MQLGQVISGKYRLLRLLGDGGMGSVYEAHHEVLGARVAIKVLHQDLAGKPELVDRFLREARVLAQIANPHVVRVLDIAMDEGTGAYIVMELLAGEPVSDLLARETRLPLATAVDYASQVLEALAAAHALGVVHRDLKPENVFVTREGERTVVKLIDFGIAKAGAGAFASLGGANANLTLHGALMGTPEYMAPEQAHSADRVDARSDLYAVGVLLYEMLSGARPVEGTDPRAVAQKIERGEVVPLIQRLPDVPRDLAGLVHRAMAARPELRFASANEMRHALDAVLAPKHTSTPPITPPPSPPLELQGSATVFGAPAGDLGTAAPAAAVNAVAAAPAPARSSAAGGTDPGGASFISTATATSDPAPALLANVAPSITASPVAGTPVMQHAQAPQAPQAAQLGQRWDAPPAVAAYGAQNVQAHRGGRRGAGGTVWLLVTIAIVLGGGIALALTFTGSGGGGASVTPKPSSTATALATAAPTETAPPPDPAADPAIGPLPGSALVPSSRPNTPVPRSSSPTPSTPAGSSSSAAPSTPPLAANPPFGVPPFSIPGMPSSFPNPFPNPASSGVGPVITIPTTFPNFGFPPDPNEPVPPTAPGRHKNH